MSSLYEILHPDFEFQDARGRLTQLVHTGYEQVNVVFSNAGVTRGGHYHKESREAFFVVSGSVKVSLSHGQACEERMFEKGEFFLIHPEVIHSMFYPEDCVLIAMYDRCVESENGEKDIHAVWSGNLRKH